MNNDRIGIAYGLMTEDEKNELAQANLDGKDIETYMGRAGWQGIKFPNWDKHVAYRIKPKIEKLDPIEVRAGCIYGWLRMSLGEATIGTSKEMHEILKRRNETQYQLMNSSKIDTETIPDNKETDPTAIELILSVLNEYQNSDFKLESNRRQVVSEIISVLSKRRYWIRNLVFEIARDYQKATGVGLPFSEGEEIMMAALNAAFKRNRQEWEELLRRRTTIKELKTILENAR